MLRIIAFIVNAHERLQFTKGLSDDDEPDLWQKSLIDEIELWIELGAAVRTTHQKRLQPKSADDHLFIRQQQL